MDGCVLTVAARANNGEQLVLADGFGRVRLLRYPAVNDDQVRMKTWFVWFGKVKVCRVMMDVLRSIVLGRVPC